MENDHVKKNKCGIDRDDVHLALESVLVSSTIQSSSKKGITNTEDAYDPCETPVRGPSDYSSMKEVLNRFSTIGFQASHVGQAFSIARKGLLLQSPSRQYVVRDGEFVEIPVEDTQEKLVRPLYFLGLTAQLLGTGCREAVKFLIKEGVEPKVSVDVAKDESPQKFGLELCEDVLGMKNLWKEMITIPSAISSLGSSSTFPFKETSCSHYSFLSCLVVSGGAIEHDIRRACESYSLIPFASEATQGAGNSGVDSFSSEAAVESSAVLFGNISHHISSPHASLTNPTLYEMTMSVAAHHLHRRQERLESEASAAPPPSEEYFDCCSWNMAPSDVWCWIGIHLPLLFAEAIVRRECWRQKNKSLSSEVLRAKMGDPTVQEEALERARSTVVYWAAQQSVPIFSPSFVDGNVMHYMMETHYPLIEEVNDIVKSSNKAFSVFMLDLVQDIHRINKMAMSAARTSVLVCGGGVVKHHICNANLMRNGADYAIFINNGQEFDGSDAGAKPEEALSWGKLRFDSQHVKIYGEVSTIFPLIVGEVFVKAVREREAQKTL